MIIIKCFRNRDRYPTLNKAINIKPSKINYFFFIEKSKKKHVSFYCQITNLQILKSIEDYPENNITSIICQFPFEFHVSVANEYNIHKLYQCLLAIVCYLVICFLHLTRLRKKILNRKSLRPVFLILF